MGIMFNRPSDNEKRKQLRSKMTGAEAILWARLRNRQCGGLKFRREYGIGRFVVDFYCPSLRLAIEVDGPSHQNPESQAYDVERQELIESLSIKLLRFTNEEVFTNIGWVLECIENEKKNKNKKKTLPLFKGEYPTSGGGGGLLRVKFIQTKNLLPLAYDAWAG